MGSKRRRHLLASRVATGLVVVTVIIVLYKVLLAGYSLDNITPAVAYDIHTTIRFEGHDSAVRVKTFLPMDNPRQRIRLESLANADLSAEETLEGENRLVTWNAPSVRGPRTITVTYRVASRAVEYVLPEDSRIPVKIPDELKPFLQPTANIQVDAVEIGEILDAIAPEPRMLKGTLQAVFDFTHNKLEPIPFKGTTDALTALRLAQGSCNGKSRLFVALARRAGLPSRLVGGLILTTGKKRRSHQWVETWINGVWVPFCPLNGHFAEIPARYVRLYTGDEVLFRHTANINFDYEFNIRRRLVDRTSLEDATQPPPWASARLWEMFKRIGIPLEVLRILLMLPLGATVTVILRNVVGMRVFGTFLPALIAVACRGTGLMWGLAGFALLLAGVGMAKVMLDRMNLLHTPKLAVMLTLVILGMVGLSVLAVSMSWTDLAFISLFPIAVTTLTTERFAITVQEEGWREASFVAAQTAIAVAACYVFTESVAMQSVFLAFPELLLTVIAVDLWLGRWMGLRLVEYRRFRGLLGVHRV